MSSLIFGTAQFLQNYGLRGPNDVDERDLLETCLRLGIDTVDTAPSYGEAEVLIGAHLPGARVHTKIPGGSKPAEALLSSLSRLNRSSVDVLYFHDPATHLQDSKTVDEGLRLVGRGIDSLGISVYTEEEFDAAVEDDRIDVIQVPANVLDRRFTSERLLEARRLGKRVYARSVFLQGILLRSLQEVFPNEPLRESVAHLDRICSDVGLSRLELALRWVAGANQFDGVIVGALSAVQLEEVSCAFNRGKLPADVSDCLNVLVQPTRQDVDPRLWGRWRR
jgi:aryl-alcohol dehydrogenase-like predicted oxidoreductase